MDTPTPKKAWLDWQDVRQKVAAGLLLAAIVGGVTSVATLLWSNLSNGGVIRLLGGITPSELETKLKQERAASDLRVRALTLPGSVIIAFNGNCPSGWTLAKETTGKALYGKPNSGSLFTRESNDFQPYVPVQQQGTYADYPTPKKPKNFSPDSVGKVTNGREESVIPWFAVSFCKPTDSWD